MQRQTRDAVISDSAPDTLLLLEHFPVITLGNNANESNILLSRQELDSRSIDVHQTDRGGDVTFHGPGQLICYPIFNIARMKLGIKNFVRLLENSVIHMLADFKVTGIRRKEAPGIFVGEKKISFLGLNLKKGVTMHGLSININMDLKFFDLINPCGFSHLEVTSLAEITGQQTNPWKIAENWLEKLKRLLPGCGFLDGLLSATL